MQIYYAYLVCAIKCGLFSKKIFYTMLHLIYTIYYWLPGFISTSGTQIRINTANQVEGTGRNPKRSIHRRDVRQTDGQQCNTRAPPAKRRRTRPPPGHISPPDGVPEGHVPRSEARGFLRDSGKISLFRLQIIRFLTDPGREYKKATGLRPIAFLYFIYCPFYIRFLLVSLLKIKNL